MRARTHGGNILARGACALAWTLSAAACDAREAETTAQRTSDVLYGVHSDVAWYRDPAYRAQAIATARELRVDIMRVELLWQWIEYERGRYDWSTLDDIVGAAADAGIRLLLVVSGSPSWANGRAETDEHYYLHVPTDDERFRPWVEQYASFVAQAAQRYRGAVTLWEIGNEPNDAHFWRPRPDPRRYAVWYTALRTAIEAVDSRSQVALGGLNGLGYDLDAPGMRGTDFLEAVYAAGTAPEAVAIHPYSNRGQAPTTHVPGAGNFDDIDLVRRIISARAPTDTPIWITEWGWSIDKVSDEQQAAYLRSSLSLLESRYASHVTLATYYSHFDPTTPLHFGLYTRDFAARPAAAVMRDFLAGAD